MYNFCMYAGNTPLKGAKYPPGQKYFTIVIFRKKTSKCAKLMDETYICDNLNQIYGFFFIFNNKKKIWNSFYQKIVWKTIDWFVSYLNDYTLLLLKSSALPQNLSCYNLHDVHVSQMGGFAILMLIFL